MLDTNITQDEIPYRGSVSLIFIFSDMLRIFAAIMVVLFHYTTANLWPVNSELGTRAALNVPTVEFAALLPYVSMGWIGVPVFFVISGLIIVKSAENRTALQFAWGRVRRLLPVIFITAVIAFVISVLYSNENVGYLFFLMMKQIVIFPKGPWLDGVFWTLTVETLFYFCIFFVIYIDAFRHIERIILLWSLASTTFVVTLFLACVLLPSYANDITLFERSYPLRFLLVTTAPYFCVGCSLHFILTKGMSGMRALILGMSFVAGLCDIHFQSVTHPIYLLGHFEGTTPLLIWSLCIVGILVTMRISLVGPSVRTLQSVVRLFGLITFPLYLIHNTFGTYVLGVFIRAGVEEYVALVMVLSLCLLVSHIIVVRVEPSLIKLISRLKSFSVV